jgi:membrane associated rhomboid family serine protease
VDLLDWLPLVVAPLIVRGGGGLRAAPATKAMLIVCLVLFPIGLMMRHPPAFEPSVMLEGAGIPIGLAMMVLSSFFHLDLEHLLWNLAPVAAIGPFVEQRIGTRAIWLMAGLAVLASGLFDILLFRHTEIASVGFSAVVCAYLGALLVVGPLRWIWVWLIALPLPLPGIGYVAIMFVLLFPNLVGLSLPPVAKDFTNHMAHYAGFGAGLALTAALWSVRHFCLTAPEPIRPAIPRAPSASPPTAPSRPAPRSPIVRPRPGGAGRR